MKVEGFIANSKKLSEQVRYFDRLFAEFIRINYPSWIESLLETETYTEFSPDFCDG